MAAPTAELRELVLGEQVVILSSPSSSEPRTGTITQVIVSLVDSTNKQLGVKTQHVVQFHDGQSEHIDLRQMLEEGTLTWDDDDDDDDAASDPNSNDRDGESSSSSGAQQLERSTQRMEALISRMIETTKMMIAKERNALVKLQSIEDLCDDVERADKEVLGQYKSILLREIEGNKPPNPKELEWLKVMWRFFLAYVELYKQLLQGGNDWGQHYVFVTHRSTIKPSYVIPLSQHLDGRSILFVNAATSTGFPVRETVLSAALSCTVYWCDTTKVFSGPDSFWPLREFIIGCCRFILESEQQGSRFCLMTDCIEAREDPPGEWKDDRHRSRSGQWKEKILLTKSAEMYNKNGDPVPFPCSSKGVNRLEPLTCHYKRHCAKQLPNGDLLVSQQEETPPSAFSHQELQMHEDFLTAMFKAPNSPCKSNSIRLDRSLRQS